MAIDYDELNLDELDRADASDPFSDYDSSDTFVAPDAGKAAAANQAASEYWEEKSAGDTSDDDSGGYYEEAPSAQSDDSSSDSTGSETAPEDPIKYKSESVQDRGEEKDNPDSYQSSETVNDLNQDATKTDIDWTKPDPESFAGQNKQQEDEAADWKKQLEEYTKQKAGEDYNYSSDEFRKYKTETKEGHVDNDRRWYNTYTDFITDIDPRIESEFDFLDSVLTDNGDGSLSVGDYTDPEERRDNILDIGYARYDLEKVLAETDFDSIYDLEIPNIAKDNYEAYKEQYDEAGMTVDDLIEIFSDPNHPEYNERKEAWINATQAELQNELKAVTWLWDTAVWYDKACSPYDFVSKDPVESDFSAERERVGKNYAEAEQAYQDALAEQARINQNLIDSGADPNADIDLANAKKKVAEAEAARDKAKAESDELEGKYKEAIDAIDAKNADIEMQRKYMHNATLADWEKSKADLEALLAGNATNEMAAQFGVSAEDISLYNAYTAYTEAEEALNSANKNNQPGNPKAVSAEEYEALQQQKSAAEEALKAAAGEGVDLDKAKAAAEEAKKRMAPLEAEREFINGNYYGLLLQGMTEEEKNNLWVDLNRKSEGYGAFYGDGNINMYDRIAEIAAGADFEKYLLDPNADVDDIVDDVATAFESYFVMTKDGKHVIVPAMIKNEDGDWEHADRAEAIRYYRKTGENFGTYDTVEEAKAAQDKLVNGDNTKLLLYRYWSDQAKKFEDERAAATERVMQVNSEGNREAEAYWQKLYDYAKSKAGEYTPEDKQAIIAFGKEQSKLTKQEQEMKKYLDSDRANTKKAQILAGKIAVLKMSIGEEGLENAIAIAKADLGPTTNDYNKAYQKWINGVGEDTLTRAYSASRMSGSVDFETWCHQQFEKNNVEYTPGLQMQMDSAEKSYEEAKAEYDNAYEAFKSDAFNTYAEGVQSGETGRPKSEKELKADFEQQNPELTAQYNEAKAIYEDAKQKADNARETVDTLKEFRGIAVDTIEWDGERPSTKRVNDLTEDENYNDYVNAGLGFTNDVIELYKKLSNTPEFLQFFTSAPDGFANFSGSASEMGRTDALRKEIMDGMDALGMTDADKAEMNKALDKYDEPWVVLPNDNWSYQEICTFAYYMGSGDIDTALEYAHDQNVKYAGESREARTQKLQEFSKQMTEKLNQDGFGNKAVGTAWTAGVVAANAVNSKLLVPAAEAVDKLLTIARTGEMPITYGMGVTESGRSLIGGAAEALDENDWAMRIAGTEFTLGEVYQSVSSMIESMAMGKVGAIIGTSFGASAGAAETIANAYMNLAFGSSAFLDAVDEAYEQTGDIGKSLIIAGGAAFCEAFFEKASLEILFDKIMPDISNFATLALNTGVFSLVEGSEEVFTDLGNLVVETLAAGDMSKYKQLYKDLTDPKGPYQLSAEEAERIVKGQIKDQLVVSGISGWLSAGPTVAFHGAKNWIQQSKTGGRVLANDLVGPMVTSIKEALDSPEAFSYDELSGNTEPTKVETPAGPQPGTKEQEQAVEDMWDRGEKAQPSAETPAETPAAQPAKTEEEQAAEDEVKGILEGKASPSRRDAERIAKTPTLKKAFERMYNVTLKGYVSGMVDTIRTAYAEQQQKQAAAEQAAGKYDADGRNRTEAEQAAQTEAARAKYDTDGRARTEAEQTAQTEAARDKYDADGRARTEAEQTEAARNKYEADGRNRTDAETKKAQQELLEEAEALDNEIKSRMQAQSEKAIALQAEIDGLNQKLEAGTITSAEQKRLNSLLKQQEKNVAAMKDLSMKAGQLLNKFRETLPEAFKNFILTNAEKYANVNQGELARAAMEAKAGAINAQSDLAAYYAQIDNPDAVVLEEVGATLQAEFGLTAKEAHDVQGAVSAIVHGATGVYGIGVTGIRSFANSEAMKSPKVRQAVVSYVNSLIKDGVIHLAKPNNEQRNISTSSGTTSTPHVIPGAGRTSPSTKKAPTTTKGFVNLIKSALTGMPEHFKSLINRMTGTTVQDAVEENKPGDKIPERVKPAEVEEISSSDDIADVLTQVWAYVALENEIRRKSGQRSDTLANTINERRNGPTTVNPNPPQKSVIPAAMPTFAQNLASTPADNIYERAKRLPIPPKADTSMPGREQNNQHAAQPMAQSPTGSSAPVNTEERTAVFASSLTQDIKDLLDKQIKIGKKPYNFFSYYNMRKKDAPAITREIAAEEFRLILAGNDFNKVVDYVAKKYKTDTNRTGSQPDTKTKATKENSADVTHPRNNEDWYQTSPESPKVTRAQFIEDETKNGKSPAEANEEFDRIMHSIEQDKAFPGEVHYAETKEATPKEQAKAAVRKKPKLLARLNMTLDDLQKRVDNKRTALIELEKQYDDLRKNDKATPEQRQALWSEVSRATVDLAKDISDLNVLRNRKGLPAVETRTIDQRIKDQQKIVDQASQALHEYTASFVKNKLPVDTAAIRRLFTAMQAEVDKLNELKREKENEGHRNKNNSERSDTGVNESDTRNAEELSANDGRGQEGTTEESEGTRSVVLNFPDRSIQITNGTVVWDSSFATNESALTSTEREFVNKVSQGNADRVILVDAETLEFIFPGGKHELNGYFTITSNGQRIVVANVNEDLRHGYHENKHSLLSALDEANRRAYLSKAFESIFGKDQEAYENLLSFYTQLYRPAFSSKFKLTAAEQKALTDYVMEEIYADLSVGYDRMLASVGASVFENADITPYMERAQAFEDQYRLQDYANDHEDFYSHNEDGTHSGDKRGILPTEMMDGKAAYDIESRQTQGYTRAQRYIANKISQGRAGGEVQGKASLLSKLFGNKKSNTVVAEQTETEEETETRPKTLQELYDYMAEDYEYTGRYNSEEITGLSLDEIQALWQFVQPQKEKNGGFYDDARGDSIERVYREKLRAAQDRACNEQRRKNLPKNHTGNKLNDYENVVAEADNGIKLSHEQARFFVNSKLRDATGRLITYFHGTSNLGHTVYDFSHADDKRTLWVTNNQHIASTYVTLNAGENMASKTSYVNGIQVQEGEDASTLGKGGTVPVYVNMVNPFIIDGNGVNWAQISVTPEIQQWLIDNHYRSDLYIADQELTWHSYDPNNPVATTRELAAYAYANGYDGIVVKNIYDYGPNAALDDNSLELSDILAVFEANQVKDAENENPTTNPDYRFSLSLQDPSLHDETIIPTPVDAQPEIFSLTGDQHLEDRFSNATENTLLPKQDIALTASGSVTKTTRMTDNGELYLATVRELRNQAFRDNKEFMAKYGEKGILEFNKLLDAVGDYLQEAGETFHYLDLADINSATLSIDPMTNEINLSSMVSNGDYEVNFDFGTICERRQALQSLVDNLLLNATYDKNGRASVQLNATTLHQINEMLAKEGINTACLICFVETKRYGQQNQFGEFTTMWNKEVRKALKELGMEAQFFDFKHGVEEMSKEHQINRRKAVEAKNAATREANAQKKERGEKAGETTKEAVERMVKALAENSPEDLKLLDTGDLQSMPGRTTLAQNFPELDSLVKKKGGSAAPKPVYGFSPYNGELESLRYTGDSGTLQDHIKEIAGVRSQSFSDFIITHVFDHMQKTGGMAAMNLRGHTYTKVPARAELFGKTGEKINMSILFDIRPDINPWYAGLNAETQDLTVDLAHPRNRPYNFSDYKAKEQGDTNWVQSFPWDRAVALQNTPGFSKNVGTIGVALSYWHYKHLLADPEIRQVIGYHSSSYPKDIKDITHIDNATDYSAVQNILHFNGFVKPNYEIPAGTPSYASRPASVDAGDNTLVTAVDDNKYKDLKAVFRQRLKENPGMPRGKVAVALMQEILNYADENGYAFSTNKVKSEGAHGQFDLYGKNGGVEETRDPRMTAENYIAYCLDKGYLPQFYEFSTDPNYYKQVFDFNMYDRITGEYAPQNPVSIYDENGKSVFGSADELKKQLKAFMEEYNEQQRKTQSFINDPTFLEKVREITGDVSKMSLDVSEYDGVEEAAAEHFGTTGNYKVAGYLLQDGRMLDFSGAHWLGDVSQQEKDEWRRNNSRQVDHEDVFEAFEKNGNEFPSDSSLAFIQRGNIRMVPEIPGIEISALTEPTAKQYARIKDYIRTINQDPNNYYQNYFTIDLRTNRNTRPQSLKYEGTINPNKIVNDIKAFYRTGEVPQQSVVSQFHDRFSLADTEMQDVETEEQIEQEAEYEANYDRYSLWTGPEPVHTQYGFKLMNVDEKGLPHAMFIDAAAPYKLGVWYKADSPKMENLISLEPGYAYLVDENDVADIDSRRPVSKNSSGGFKGLPGKSLINQATSEGKRWMVVDQYADGSKSIHNVGINGSGGVSTFALRPGIHAVDIPSMSHIGAKSPGATKIDTRRPDQAWFLIEYPIDVDYNQEAFQHPTKDIREHLPERGWYSFQTNSGAEARQHWFITGGMKIVGMVSEEDVRRYAKGHGFEEDLPWKMGKNYLENNAIDLDEYIRTTTAAPTPSKQEMLNRIQAEQEAGQTNRYSLSKTDQQYMDAVNSDDMETAQAIVDKAAKKAGYKKHAYHGTLAYGFNEFRMISTSELGVHFGTEEAARVFYNNTYNRRGFGDNPGIYDVYLKMENTLKTPDVWGDPEALDTIIQRVDGWVKNGYYEHRSGAEDVKWTKADSKKLRDALKINDDYYAYKAACDEWWTETQRFKRIEEFVDPVTGRVYTLDEAWDMADAEAAKLGLPRTLIKDGGNGKQEFYATDSKRRKETLLFTLDAAYKGIAIQDRIDEAAWKANQLAQTYLKNLGFDSIRYINEMEDIGSESYIILEPTHIKSAEPVTYDDNGNIIPPSQRFDGDIKDIRFSLLHDVVDTEGNVYDDVVRVTYPWTRDILSSAEEFDYYVQQMMPGKEITTLDEDGEKQVITFANADDMVIKHNFEHPALSELSSGRKTGVRSWLVYLNAQELLDNSTFDHHEPQNPDWWNNHDWFDKNGWDYRTAYMMDKYNKIYPVTLYIANTSDGRKILYHAAVTTPLAKDVDIPATAKNNPNENFRRFNRFTKPEGYVDRVPAGKEEVDAIEERLSLKTDSEGNQLSEGQAEYFADSKAVDENGNLLVLYHGTDAYGFTIFDPQYADDKRSMFFTTDPDIARSYISKSDKDIKSAMNIDGTRQSLRDLSEDDFVKYIRPYIDDQGFLIMAHGTQKELVSMFAEQIRMGATNIEYFLEPYRRELSDETNEVIRNSIEVLNAISKADNVNDFMDFYGYARSFLEDLENELKENGVRTGLNIGQIDRNLVFLGDVFSREYPADEHLYLLENRYISKIETKSRLLRDLESHGYSTGTSSGIYPVYANLTRPLVIDANGEHWNEIPVSKEISKYLTQRLWLTGDEEAEYYSSYAGKDITNTRGLAKYAQDHGYDGVIIHNVKDIGASGYEGRNKGFSTIAVAFNSDQIKDIGNKNPTHNPDMRFSIKTDSDGNELSQGQKEYFADSKVVDDNGNLLALYHGGNNFGYTEIDFASADDKISYFMTSSPGVAGSYGYSNRIRSTLDEEEFEAILDKPVEDMTDRELAKAFLYLEPVEDVRARKYGEVLREASAAYESNIQKVIDAFGPYSEQHQRNSDLLQRSEAGINLLRMFNVSGNQEFVKGAKNTLESLVGFDRGISNYDESTEYHRALQKALDSTIFLIRVQHAGRRIDSDSDTIFVADNKQTLSKWAIQSSIKGTLSDRNYGVRIGARGSGVYKVYANITNPFIIDANGANWNEIGVPMEVYDYLSALPNEHPEYEENYFLGQNGVKTRGIARYAKDHGYNGVVIKNCVDSGPGGYFEPSTLVVAFDQNQVKDAKNLNPTEHPDMRYSLSINEAFDEFGYDVQPEDTNPTDLTQSALSENLYYSNDGNTAYYQTPTGETVILNNVGTDSPEAQFINYLEANNNANSINTTTTEPYTIPAATRDEYDGYNLGEQDAGLRRGPQEIPSANQEGTLRRTGGTLQRNGQSGSQSASQESVDRFSFALGDDDGWAIYNDYGEDITYTDNYPYGSFYREIVDAMHNNTDIEDLKNYLEGMAQRVAPEDVDANLDMLKKIVDANPRMSDMERQNMYRTMEALQKKYGGFKVAKDDKKKNIPIPRKLDKDTKVMKFTKTVEANAETEWLTDETMKKVIEDAMMSYVPMSNEKAIKEAMRIWDRENGNFERLLRHLEDKLNMNDRITPVDVALGEYMLREAEANGRVNDAMRLVADLALMGHNTGQTLQAFRILKKLTPRGQLYYLNGVIKQLNERYKKDNPNIKIDEALVRKLLASQTRKELDDTMDEIKHNIADQLPVHWWDRWNAWRYVAMLGNPRTHVRNAFGNGMFVPAVLLKDFIAAELENRTNWIDPNLRTKTLPSEYKNSAVFRKFALEQTEVMKDILAGKASGNKFTDVNEIIGMRDLWGSTPLGKAIKAWDETNSNWLEAEDYFFLSRYFQRALMQFLQARGVTEQDLMNGFGGDRDSRKLLNEARAWAVLEAQRNTYRDANAAATQLNRLKRAGLVPYTLLEGAVPFTKTPLNILARGIEYSPIGLIKSAIMLGRDLRSGEYTTSEVLDRLAAGASGTALTILGALFASIGWLRGSGPSDDELAEFEELQGHQNWAVEIGGKSYTIDWMAPAALPLFIGVSIMNMLQGDINIESAWDIGTAFARLAEPLSSLSMLDGINNLLTTMSTADKTERYSTLAWALLTSYISQGVPTILGQAARSMDPDQRRTYIDQNKATPDALQRFIQSSLQAKIPLWEMQRMAYVDAWGRTDTSDTTGEWIWKVFENFLSPGYGNTINMTPVDEELQRLFEATGDNTIFPDMLAKKYNVNGEEKNLTAAEYEQLMKTSGATAYDIAYEVIMSPEYAQLDDAGKMKLLDQAFEYAKNYGKTVVTPEYEMSASWMDTAQKVGASDYIRMRSLLPQTYSNDQLFAYLAVNPNLSNEQIADIVADEFSAPRQIYSTEFTGYVYDITDEDKDAMQVVFRDNLYTELRKMFDSVEYNRADPRERGYLIDDAYTRAREKTKQDYGTILDSEGRVKDLGRASAVGKEKWGVAINATEKTTAEQAKYLSDSYAPDHKIDNPDRLGYVFNLNESQYRDLKDEFAKEWEKDYEALLSSKAYLTAETDEDRENMVAAQFNKTSKEVEEAFARGLKDASSSIRPASDFANPDDRYGTVEYNEDGEEVDEELSDVKAGWKWTDVYKIATENFKTVEEMAEWMAGKMTGATSIDNPDRIGHKMVLDEAQKATEARHEQETFKKAAVKMMNDPSWQNLTFDEKAGALHDLEVAVAALEEGNYARYLLDNGYDYEDKRDVSSSTNQTFFTMLMTDDLTKEEAFALLDQRYTSKVGTSIKGNSLSYVERAHRVDAYMEYIAANYDAFTSKYLTSDDEATLLKAAAAFEKSLHKSGMSQSGNITARDFGITTKVSADQNRENKKNPNWTFERWMTNPIDFTSASTPYTSTGTTTTSSTTRPVIPPKNSTNTGRTYHWSSANRKIP